MRQLISLGANPYLEDTDGMNAISMAVEHARIDILRYFFECRFNINFPNSKLKTPLLAAKDPVMFMLDEEYIQIWSLMLKGGANIKCSSMTNPFGLRGVICHMGKEIFVFNP